jgi:hypothetical protein
MARFTQQIKVQSVKMTALPLTYIFENTKNEETYFRIHEKSCNNQGRSLLIN